MKITFLTHSVDHIGGITRATLNTASALTDLGHEVEIANVFKYRHTPRFRPDPRVAVRNLVDLTTRWSPLSALTGLPDWLRSRRPSTVYPIDDTRSREFNQLTDRRVAEFLAGCDADVVVGTRPGLNVYVARHVRDSAVAVGQEHLFYEHHQPRLREAMTRDFHRLDALVTVSRADAETYRQRMPELAERVRFIPNSIQPTSLEPSTVDSKLIVAAGRLAGSKRFNMLVNSFAIVHERHPDWRLRIYGSGRRLESLRQLVDELGLNDHVTLMGRATPLDAEWVKGSIAAMTSKFESFGLTLVEAMNCGLPVVSTACPHGPPEIVDHEVDGLLTPVKGKAAFADALCRLIEDDAMRRRMSANAIAKARQYHPHEIGARYEDLFSALVARKHRTPPRGSRIPVGLTAGGGTSLPGAPVGDGTTPDDQGVHCAVTSFEDLTLRARHGFSGSYTLRSPDCPVFSVPVGAAIRLDPAWLSRLPEGAWKLYRDDQPVEAGRIDSRALVRRPATLPSSVVVPYAADGQFALRVWRRETYAEVNTVAWRDGLLHITGDVLGSRWPDTEVRITAKARDIVAAPHSWDAVIGASGAFSASIDVDRLCDDQSGRKTLWDLWLTDRADERAPVRLARFFDDIARRKQRQTYPVHQVEREGRQRVQPYYTVHNDLSLRVEADG